MGTKGHMKLFMKSSVTIQGMIVRFVRFFISKAENFDIILYCVKFTLFDNLSSITRLVKAIQHAIQQALFRTFPILNE